MENKTLNMWHWLLKSMPVGLVHLPDVDTYQSTWSVNILEREVNKTDARQVWASTEPISTIPCQGHILFHWASLSSILSVHPWQDLQIIRLSKQPEAEKVLPRWALFHLLPHIQCWHLLRCIPSPCQSHYRPTHFSTSYGRFSPNVASRLFFLCITYVQVIFPLLHSSVNRKKKKKSIQLPFSPASNKRLKKH